MIRKLSLPPPNDRIEGSLACQGFPNGQQAHNHQQCGQQGRPYGTDYLFDQTSNAQDTAVGKCEADIRVEIYVAGHCPICAYAYEIADFISEHFPTVTLRVINIETTREPIPEAVFATPTYMLNDRVWSLGNPSPVQVREKLRDLMSAKGREEATTR
ncbi:MAG: hypothetical protein R3A44_26325 [Caldilineaceae bacterium]